MRCGIAEEDAGWGTGASSSSSPSPPSESDDEDEDEDKDGDGDDLVACGFIGGASLKRVFLGTSDSSDEESKESEFDEDEDEAWRRLRFLLRLRGAVGLAAGMMVLECGPVRRGVFSMLAYTTVCV